MKTWLYELVVSLMVVFCIALLILLVIVAAKFYMLDILIGFLVGSASGLFLGLKL